jgi:hypothetical protein
MENPETRIGLDENGEARWREIQLLVNIVMPDPSCQPFYLSDDATLFEIYNHKEAIIRQRLSGYFGGLIGVDIRQPIWKLVDELKKLYPGWPEEWE